MLKLDLPTIFWRAKSLLLWLSFAMLTACQPASLGSSKPVSAGVLSQEYGRSSADVRSKYDGKEIVIQGYALAAATMTPTSVDQGSVLLEEKEDKHEGSVACWFSKDQAQQFLRIQGGQYITVKGIFNGEAGAQLKFCKLIRIE